MKEKLGEGEEKLKLAFAAGKKNTSDKSVKNQLQVSGGRAIQCCCCCCRVVDERWFDFVGFFASQSLKEEWTRYKKNLEESKLKVEGNLQETGKYEKLFVEFEEWLKQMENSPHNDVRIVDIGACV